jgi:hypothetical protein
MFILPSAIFCLFAFLVASGADFRSGDCSICEHLTDHPGEGDERPSTVRHILASFRVVACRGMPHILACK